MKSLRGNKLLRYAALTVLFALLIACEGALTEEVAVSVEAYPSGYFEAFDTTVEIKITNSLDRAIVIERLNAADRDIDIKPTTVAAGEVYDIYADVRVEDSMLDRGHFYVTLYYAVSDSEGISASSLSQTICRVKKLEDKIDAEIRFALPDRLPGGEDETIVSYIFENTGETDIKNAVIICYPEGYLSVPSYVPAGGYTAVKRLVPMAKLNEVRAVVTCESAYSGEQYNFEKTREDTSLLSRDAHEAEKNIFAVENGRQNEETVSTGKAPELSASLSDDGAVVIGLSAGSDDLLSAEIKGIDGESVRTLPLIRAGLTTQMSYKPNRDSIYGDTVSVSAKLKEGGDIFLSASVPEYVYKVNDSGGEQDDILQKLIDAPRIADYVAYASAAVLAVLAVEIIISRRKRARANSDAQAGEGDGK